MFGLEVQFGRGFRRVVRHGEVVVPDDALAFEEKTRQFTLAIQNVHDLNEKAHDLNEKVDDLNENGHDSPPIRCATDFRRPGLKRGWTLVILLPPAGPYRITLEKLSRPRRFCIMLSRRAFCAKQSYDVRGDCFVAKACPEPVEGWKQC